MSEHYVYACRCGREVRREIDQDVGLMPNGWQYIATGKWREEEGLLWEITELVCATCLTDAERAEIAGRIAEYVRMFSPGPNLTLLEGGAE
jgi:hypothetical protein